MPDFFIKVSLAYLLGSVLGALWVGFVLGHVDIRQMGSGNAGGTNALRTQGWFFALLVVLIDVGKGALAAGWLPGLALPGVAPSAVDHGWLQAACAAAAVAGHVFPLYHGFRGGKGAATLVGALAVMAWPVLIAVLAVWILLTTTTGLVGLATMLSAAAGAAFSAVRYGMASPVFGFTAAMALFIVFTHRSNIRRMREGTENRLTRLMLIKPRKPSSGRDDTTGR